MLVANFKSAIDLGITELQLDALRKTLVFLETGRLVHVPIDDNTQTMIQRSDQFDGLFNMHSWFRIGSCGTIACIGGTAELISGEEFGNFSRTSSGNPAMSDLFEPKKIDFCLWKDITTAQAATALRSYLTTGSANWEEAVR